MCVDVDRVDLAVDLDLPETWHQKTPRGRHFLYRWDGVAHNKPMPWGDIRAAGYIVGSGSVVGGTPYTYEGGTPQNAPTWLAEALAGIPEGSPRAVIQEPRESAAIPYGQHDTFLHRFASWLRGQWGLSEEAIREALAGLHSAGILEGEGNQRAPFGERDFARIARSAARYEASGPQAYGHYRSGAEVAGASLTEWILPGFVPSDMLTIMYGGAKVGKSSWGSWLTARLSLRGAHTLWVASGEETFEVFVQRVREGRGDLAKVWEFLPTAWDLTEPNFGRLETAINGIGGIKLVWIDALYSHFGASRNGENEAQRARDRLTRLADLARRLKVAIIAVTHENKQGSILGSVELRNVARSLLRARRRRIGPLLIEQRGSNLWQPDYALSHEGYEVPVLGADGLPFSFADIWGNEIAHTTWALSDPEPHANGTEELTPSEVQE
ncbi:MAG: AAA family ATPase, partial [Candidatus Dormibacteria bacterium]